jgi:hypothetical protein
MDDGEDVLDLSRAPQGLRRLQLGIYLDDGGGVRPSLDLIESRTRARFDLEASFWSWGLGLIEAPFARARVSLAEGRIPFLTWEPWTLPPAGADPAEWPGNRRFALRRIVAGDFDPYIRSWAERLRDLQAAVYLRPMHEMNGNWYPWCGTRNGNSARDYREAWRHLHRLFAAAGADNVRWVWCPYARSVPERSDNAIAEYFPGDSCVDLLSLDGYNRGVTGPTSRWETFEGLFEPAYRLLTALSAKPVVIAEVGCAEQGGSKPAWLAETFTSIQTSFDRVEAVVWFNVDKECDWRLDSSPESLRAFQRSWSTCTSP